MTEEEARDLKKIHDNLRAHAVEINRLLQKNAALTNKIIDECKHGTSEYTALAVEFGKSAVLAQVGKALIAYMKKHKVQ